MEKARQKQFEEKKAELQKTIQILDSERQNYEPFKTPFIKRDQHYENFFETN